MYRIIYALFTHQWRDRCSASLQMEISRTCDRQWEELPVRRQSQEWPWDNRKEETRDDWKTYDHYSNSTQNSRFCTEISSLITPLFEWFITRNTYHSIGSFSCLDKVRMSGVLVCIQFRSLHTSGFSNQLEVIWLNKCDNLPWHGPHTKDHHRSHCDCFLQFTAWAQWH